MKHIFRFIIIVAIFLAHLTTSFAQSQFSISPHGYDTICHGKTIAVEAVSGYHNYHWSSGQHDRVIQISNSGVYICFANDSSGHTFKDSIMVSMYPIKQLDIYSNPAQLNICKGQKVILEASSGFLSYSWSKHLTGHRIDFYPDVTLWFFLEANDSNHCSYRDSVHIVVNNCNDCKVIEASSKSICKQGDTIILEARNGYTNYMWSNGSTGRVIYITTPGKYLIEVTDSSGHKCTDSIEIISGARNLYLHTNPNPPVVCKNKLVVIEANSGFVLYDWNVTGSGNRVEYVAENSKKIILYAKDSNGCIAVADVQITVHDTCLCSGIIHAYPKTTLCGVHDSIHLEASGGYVVYEWSNNSHDRLIWAKQQGWYWVEVVDSNGHHCRDSIYINYSTIPSVHINTNPDPPKICKGDKIIIEASNGFKEYHWSNAMHGNRLELYPEKTMELVLESVTELGCSARSSIKITVDSCSLNIENQSFGSLKIFPNPVVNHVFSISSDLLKINGIQIFDLAGKEIKSVMTYNNNKIDIQLLNCSNGVLIVKIYTEKSVITKLLSVE